MIIRRQKNDRAQIHMDYETHKGGLHQTIELRSRWIEHKTGLGQTIQLRSILIMGRQKVAAPDDRAQIQMAYGTPKGGAAPDDRAQIHMDLGPPKGSCSRR